MRRAPSSRPRSRPLAPLVHLAALVLLAEAWTWEVGARWAAALAAWPPLRRLEEHVSRLPAWAALTAFLLPGLLLLPVKLLALLAIGHGHAGAGIAGFVAAKLGGAAVVARIYLLTRPTLLGVGWFARCHGAFLAFSDRLLSLLRASPFYLRARRLVAAWRQGARRLARRLRRRLRPPAAHPPSSHLLRVLRRFSAQWRARRNKSTGTGQP
ncbi:hypothetical protein B0920_19255 [Massilia sp. KIM]|uniref:hypothetical protein n=1 Tax=Massilia sp. KIM TaxID=1955422 RepID=UPI00098F9F82|nr:hypothetical protein [Massilia sp. KIM]OON61067.1 hypothetical protein B0920_19255 [Massilia sp. KIM]